jgi:Bax protein
VVIQRPRPLVARRTVRQALILLLVALLAAVLIVGGLRLRASYQEVARETAPSEEPRGLTVRHQPLTSPDDIVPLESDRVPPITYRGNVSLAGLPVPEKKEKFFALMLPQVLLVKQELADRRAEVERIAAAAQPTQEDRIWLEGMLDRYRADDVEQLLVRLQDHPTSIVLAQAALESGWGTSRFFREGNNVFGVWSFDENEPRMAAGETRGERTIWVKRYPSLRGSIADYFVTIGRGPYTDFRRARLEKDDPLALIRHLQRYSELGDEYVRRLALTIRSNDLHRFDRYRLGTGLLAMEGR